jgi:hypothetical protein
VDTGGVAPEQRQMNPAPDLATHTDARPLTLTTLLYTSVVPLSQPAYRDHIRPWLSGYKESESLKS